MKVHVIFIFTVASSDLITSLNGEDSLQNCNATKVYNYPVTANDQGVLQYFKSEDERCQPGHPQEPPQQQGPDVLPVSLSSDGFEFCAEYGKSVCISLSVAILSTFQRHQSKSSLLFT